MPCPLFFSFAQWCSRTVRRCRTKMHYRSALRHRRRTDDQPGPRREKRVGREWLKDEGGGGDSWLARANESKVKAPLVWQLRACTPEARVIDAAVHFLSPLTFWKVEAGLRSPVRTSFFYPSLSYLGCSGGSWRAKRTADVGVRACECKQRRGRGLYPSLLVISESLHSTKLML